ncbi:hypothetical protein [Rhizobium grahamii]|uniref:Transmembrane protein n=1 Tax=Rhizobium grahamii CCGE 502 TaxID=990285 RepID=S3HGR5_9HYPH|nr:hypothetical protein [Rhizobium grahamii]EPE97255.1 hypothetical protein RGCCGE502_14440 [Rhizobium grahamii CCGE 502]
MQFHAIAPVFLVLAMALSWPRFASIFSPHTNADVATAPLTTIATAINLSAIGLAFAGNDPGPAVLIVLVGVFLGAVMRAPAPPISVALSVASLAVSLQLS